MIDWIGEVGARKIKKIESVKIDDGWLSAWLLDWTVLTKRNIYLFGLLYYYSAEKYNSGI